MHIHLFNFYLVTTKCQPLTTNKYSASVPSMNYMNNYRILCFAEYMTWYGYETCIYTCTYLYHIQGHMRPVKTRVSLRISSI